MTRRGRVEGEGEEKREGEVKRLAETLHLPSVTWQTSLASIYKFLGYQIWKSKSFSPLSSDSDLDAKLLRITSGIQFLTLGFREFFDTCTSAAIHVKVIFVMIYLRLLEKMKIVLFKNCFQV